VIDGALSSEEWAGALVDTMSDGSEIFLLYHADDLYLGLRSATPERISANVFLEDVVQNADQGPDQIRILHASAALGTAIYRQDAALWHQIQGFDWTCRDSSDSEAAWAERAAHLQDEGWVAANAWMGTPNELEYRIALPPALPPRRLAVSVMRSSAPDARTIWPLTLDDDCARPTPGGMPQTLAFALDGWAIIDVYEHE
jgi:hypothetical protein